MVDDACKAATAPELTGRATCTIPRPSPVMAHPAREISDGDAVLQGSRWSGCSTCSKATTESLLSAAETVHGSPEGARSWPQLKAEDFDCDGSPSPGPKSKQLSTGAVALTSLCSHRFVNIVRGHLFRRAHCSGGNADTSPPCHQCAESAPLRAAPLGVCCLQAMPAELIVEVMCCASRQDALSLGASCKLCWGLVHDEVGSSKLHRSWLLRSLGLSGDAYSSSDDQPPRRQSGHQCIPRHPADPGGVDPGGSVNWREALLLTEALWASLAKLPSPGSKVQKYLRWLGSEPADSPIVRRVLVGISLLPHSLGEAIDDPCSRAKLEAELWRAIGAAQMAEESGIAAFAAAGASLPHSERAAAPASAPESATQWGLGLIPGASTAGAASGSEEGSDEGERLLGFGDRSIAVLRWLCDGRSRKLATTPPHGRLGEGSCKQETALSRGLSPGAHFDFARFVRLLRWVVEPPPKEALTRLRLLLAEFRQIEVSHSTPPRISSCLPLSSRSSVCYRPVRRRVQSHSVCPTSPVQLPSSRPRTREPVQHSPAAKHSQCSQRLPMRPFRCRADAWRRAATPLPHLPRGAQASRRRRPPQQPAARRALPASARCQWTNGGPALLGVKSVKEADPLLRP